ncbi:MAG: PmoA family protein [Pirellulales bacterium]
MRSVFYGLTLLALFVCAATAAPPVVTLEKNDAGVAVTIDGKPFTQYVVKSKTKPILWPIVGVDGLPLTRSWPMAEQPNEKHDHPHHRSLWFTHGEVNGIDFWMEEPSKDGKQPGVTEHQEFKTVRSGTSTEPCKSSRPTSGKCPTANRCATTYEP